MCKQTIWEVFISSPLNLNVIAGGQLMQAIGEVEIVWRRVHRRSSEPLPSHSTLHAHCPPPMCRVSNKKKKKKSQTYKCSITITQNKTKEHERISIPGLESVSSRVVAHLSIVARQHKPNMSVLYTKATRNINHQRTQQKNKNEKVTFKSIYTSRL